MTQLQVLPWSGQWSEGAGQDSRTSSASGSVTISSQDRAQDSPVVTMMVVSLLSVLVVVLGLVAGQDTREDGLCGPWAGDAKCEHM